jgi:tetratricopeptide (TPR) repeat protein
LPPIEAAEIPFDPKSATPELYVGMAQMSHRGGNVQQGRQFYQKALAMDGNHLEALLGAARMEDREGRLDVAQMLYQRAAAAHPNNATALNDLALCLARRGDLAGAGQTLEQAIRLEPGKALYRNNVAKVLVELNQLDQATAHLVAVHPPAVAHYNMGVLLSERGRQGEAVDYLTTAIAIDPNMEPARTMLAGMTPPPTIMPGAAPQSMAQVNPAPMQPAMPDSNDSILPTPENVATVPWRPPISMDAELQQAPVEQTPALLPPVNQ